ncbi:MAG: BrnT family toxin [Alphaproteobacteria bacterium]|nr:BrnT family toxin [Alphaproteobacteria bacterium]
MFEWDEKKRAHNLEKHGVDFADVWELDWRSAFRLVDGRREYGETRFLVLGTIEGRLHVCVYVQRGAAFRIISLRKANKREERHYAKATEKPDNKKR